jgi:hypothetical protein
MHVGTTRLWLYSAKAKAASLPPHSILLAFLPRASLRS